MLETRRSRTLLINSTVIVLAIAVLMIAPVAFILDLQPETVSKPVRYMVVSSIYAWSIGIILCVFFALMRVAGAILKWRDNGR